MMVVCLPIAFFFFRIYSFLLNVDVVVFVSKSLLKSKLLKKRQVSFPASISSSKLLCKINVSFPWTRETWLYQDYHEKRH